MAIGRTDKEPKQLGREQYVYSPDSADLPPWRTLRMLRPHEVRARLALSNSHLHRLMTQGRCPKFRTLAGRSCGLPEHELDCFIADRMEARAELAPLGFRTRLPEWSFDLSKVPPLCGLRLLRRREVEALTGLPKSTFYPLIPKGLFPAQVSLGERAVRWVAHELDAWILATAPPLSSASVAPNVVAAVQAVPHVEEGI